MDLPKLIQNVKTFTVKGLIRDREGIVKHQHNFLIRCTSLLDRFMPKHNIFREKWDNLIILDACRFDFFKKAVKIMKIEGKLQKIFSPGTHTITFCEKTFTKEKYNDIVCINANPHVGRTVGHKFHDIISVWSSNWCAIWGTVLPEDMTQSILNATIQYPNKRLLIWYVQPHYPFIGYYITPTGAIEGCRSYVLFKDFEMFFNCDLTKKELRKRYMENLIRVLGEVKKVLKFLHGKTIITSDHGESLGDYFFPIIPIRVYGHYKDVKNRKMLIVPWFVCE